MAAGFEPASLACPMFLPLNYLCLVPGAGLEHCVLAEMRAARSTTELTRSLSLPHLHSN